MYLSVVIPAYNEAKRISQTLDDVSAYLSNQPWESEIIVVSDGSSDETSAIALSHQGKYKQIRCISYTPNRGKGYAVQKGMMSATGDLLLFMDADNATPIAEFTKLLPYVASGYDTVIGSLGVAGAKFDRRKLWIRMVAGRISNWIIQSMLLPGIQDTQRGFKLFTKESADRLFPMLRVSRWGFDIELLALARHFGFRIKEVPVLWSHVAQSKVTIFSYLKVFLELLYIKFRIIRLSLKKTTKPSPMKHGEYCARFVKPRGTILDVGSGKGDFLVDMASRGFEVFGVETSSEYIHKTKEKALQKKVTATVKKGRGESIPFPDSHFNFANCSEVTEHVDDPVALCREIFRVLKTEGQAYISFHNRFGIYDYHYHLYFINWIPRNLTEPILHLFGKRKEDSRDIGRQKLATMHYFRFGEIEKLLSTIGFDVHDIRLEKLPLRFPILWPFVRVLYLLIARPFYFNTFHLLISKS